MGEHADAALAVSAVQLAVSRHQVDPDRDQARMDVFWWIEATYNRTRRHSRLGYLSPVDYEAMLRRAAATSEPSNQPLFRETGAGPARPGRLSGGAAHDQPVAPIAGLGDLGQATIGVDDVDPGVLWDGGDRGADRRGLADGDGVADPVAAAGPDRLGRPESRVHGA